MTQAQTTLTTPNGRRRVVRIATVACALLLIGAAVLIVAATRSTQSPDSGRPIPYIGVYERDSPFSYTGVAQFAKVTGVTPDVIMYYSAWLEPFQTSFAITAAEHGAEPLVQINPFGVSLSAIASGRYDAYLTSYAEAVQSYHRPVILSFGHEMNGHWYPWGYTHTSPEIFIAAWRHIVTLFRGLEVKNVTWLWTVNIIDTAGGIASPGPWWPGSSYVTWVGIDGYYFSPSWQFDPLFGPTIAAVRSLTRDPILLAETGVATAAGQPAKIADLFAGIRLYGLLGFVWFDADDSTDWRITGPAAIEAFRQGAETYRRPVS